MLMVLSVPRDLSKQPAMLCSKPWHCKCLDTVFDQWKILRVPPFSVTCNGTEHVCDVKGQEDMSLSRFSQLSSSLAVKARQLRHHLN